MATISEDFVSFETAKLLKEKGFDVKCDKCYAYFADDDIRFLNLKYPKSSQLLIEDRYPCMTLQMTMKWLREVHNIHIAIIPCEVGPGVMDYTYILYKVDTENFIFKDLEIQGRANTDKMSASKTCEAAIKYCLEHLV